jgi:glutamine synthetase
VCWGYDNREAPVRVCCPRGGPQAVNAEYKAFDGTANPYIGLAAVVAAGMLGEQGS